MYLVRAHAYVHTHSSKLDLFLCTHYMQHHCGNVVYSCVIIDT